jgi:predicted NBD/HSP70 family sugar kinase
MVFGSARSGQPWAKKLVKETVDYLALAIANPIVILDPELIVLSGVSHSADLFINPIQKRLEGVFSFTPRLVASNLESKAVALGTVISIWNATNDCF